MNTTTTTTYERSSDMHKLWHPMQLARVSWGAIFAGLVVALITYLLLSVLGAAIGASALDPTDQSPFSGFGTGVSIWAAAATAIAIAAGAFVTGYFSCCEGMIHGIMTWAMTTLVTVWMLFVATSGALNVATGVTKAGLSAAGQVANVSWNTGAPVIADLARDKLGIDFDFNELQNELEKLMKQSGKSELSPEHVKNAVHDSLVEGKANSSHAATNPQKADDDLRVWFDRVMRRADNALNAADKEALVNIIAARSGKSHAEAEKIAARYEKVFNDTQAKFEEAKVKAEKMARDGGVVAVRSVARGSWSALLVLLIGAVIGAVMGGIGFHSGCRRHRLDNHSSSLNV